MEPDWRIYLVRIIGAIVGSSLAVVFDKGDNWAHRFERFMIGGFFGAICSALLIHWFEWPDTLDFWLLSSFLCGLVGYLFLQLLFSDWAKSLLNKYVEKTMDAIHKDKGK